MLCVKGSSPKRSWEAGGLAWGAGGIFIADQHGGARLVKADGLSKSSLSLFNFDFLSVLEKKPLFLSVVFNYRTVASRQ